MSHQGLEEPEMEKQDLCAKEVMAEEVPTAPHSSDVEALLQLFQQAVSQRRKNTLNMGVSAALSVAFAVANILTLQYLPPNDRLIDVAIGALILTFALSFRGLSRLKSLMIRLVDISDLRVVGPLLEIAAAEEGNAKNIATALLIRLLPRFRASDAKMLTDTQYLVLLRMLIRSVPNCDFFVAALKALEQVGDVRVLPVVQDLGSISRNSGALCMNARGDAVGWSNTTDYGTTAVLWRQGVIVDLNKVVPDGTGCTLEQAVAIDDLGRIVCKGTCSGEEHSFLLLPIIHGVSPKLEQPMSTTHKNRTHANRKVKNKLMSAGLQSALGR